MKYMYRITKYNPINRDKSDKYLVNDWTSKSDIGQIFNGIKLTEVEYYKIEDSYVNTIKNFIQELEITQLTVLYHKNEVSNLSNPVYKNKSIINIDEDLEKVVRNVLSEKFWCQLVWKKIIYIHFGYDYYMYVGTSCLCSKSIQQLQENNLFVESFPSPYL